METPPDVGDVTRLLANYCEGDKQAMEKLLPLVYDELRRIAGGYMRKENPSHTLQATALVHEAYFRLVDQKHVVWQCKAHFLGVAAQMMRRILVDHARAKHAEKRGGDAVNLTLEDDLVAAVGATVNVDLILLDDVLNRLAELDERQAKVVELRFFGGLSNEEVAEVVGVSLATVKRDWTVAKAWLKKEMQQA